MGVQKLSLSMLLVNYCVDLQSMITFPWLICGDHNQCFWENEKRGGAPRKFQSMELFRETFSDLNLLDFGHHEVVFTCSNKGKKSSSILKRLDMFLCNNVFSLFSGYLKVHHLDWYSSNQMHICIVMNVDANESGHTRYEKDFKFRGNVVV